MMKHSPSIIATAVCTALTVIATASPIAHAINQGDAIYTPTDECTVGYIDKHRSQAWIAAHCTRVGDTVRDGHNNIIGNTIAAGQEFPEGQDWAVVQLYAEHVGHNRFAELSNRKAHVGDEVCAWSRRSQHISCGVVNNRKHHTGYLRFRDHTKNNQATLPGDSGGPVWLKNGGLIGQVTRGDGLVVGVATEQAERQMPAGGNLPLPPASVPVSIPALQPVHDIISSSISSSVPSMPPLVIPELPALPELPTFGSSW